MIWPLDGDFLHLTLVKQKSVILEYSSTRIYRRLGGGFKDSHGLVDKDFVFTSKWMKQKPNTFNRSFPLLGSTSSETAVGLETTFKMRSGPRPNKENQTTKTLSKEKVTVQNQLFSFQTEHSE